MGIGANAQTTLLEDNFDTTTTGSAGAWTAANIGTLAFYPYNIFAVQSACAANLISVRSLQVTGIPSSAGASCSYQNIAATNVGFAPLVYRQVDASSYDNLKLSYKWKCGGEVDKDYGQLVYSLDKVTWTPISTKLQGQTTTQTITDLALPTDIEHKIFYIGWIFYADATTAVQPGLTVDDVKLTGVAPANCSGIPRTATLSANIGSSGSIVTATSAGYSAGGGISYQWQISTNSGTTWNDVTGATTLPSNITIPTGTLGDILLYRLKVTCADSGQIAYSGTTSFKLDYCAVTADAATNKFPITSVKIGTLEKTSGTEPGPTVAAQEYFITDATNFAVNQSASVAMDIKVFASTSYRMGVTYFIDWNHDGDFNDAGESYNIAAPLTGTGTATESYPTVAASFTVPADAVLGNTRMRIKTNYYPATGSEGFLPFLNTACGVVGNGQAEDHILTVSGPTMAVSDVNKAGISVYPNPFTDLLKISDVKGVKSISVNDASGREVKSLAPAAELNLSSLKAGLYIVNLNMEDGSVKTFKAIKK